MSTETNPQPNESFDALIDLLATEDTADLFDFPGQRGPSALRDADGKLDFSKIRSLIGSKSADDSSKLPRHPAASRVAPENHVPASNQRDDMNSPLSEHQSLPIASESAHPPHGQALSSAERPSTIADLAGVNRISHHQSLLSPRLGVDDVSAYSDAEDQGDIELGHANDPRDHLLYDLDMALALANKEVSDLRDRCRELQSMVADLTSGKSYGSPNNVFEGGQQANDAPPPKKGTTIHSDRLTSSNEVDEPGIRSTRTTEGHNVPEHLQGGKSIETVLQALNLSYDGMLHSAVAEQSTAHPIKDLSDVERAVRFLVETDELVWRRSKYPSGPAASIFEERNVEELMERLVLWENIVRSPLSDVSRNT